MPRVMHSTQGSWALRMLWVEWICGLCSTVRARCVCGALCKNGRGSLGWWQYCGCLFPWAVALVVRQLGALHVPRVQLVHRGDGNPEADAHAELFDGIGGATGAVDEVGLLEGSARIVPAGLARRAHEL